MLGSRPTSARRIRGAVAGRLIGRVAYVRDFDALKAAADNGVEQLGRLDVIVANAGIGTTGVKLHKDA